MECTGGEGAGAKRDAGFESRNTRLAPRPSLPGQPGPSTDQPAKHQQPTVCLHHNGPFISLILAVSNSYPASVLVYAQQPAAAAQDKIAPTPSPARMDHGNGPDEPNPHAGLHRPSNPWPKRPKSSYVWPPVFEPKNIVNPSTCATCRARRRRPTTARLTVHPLQTLPSPGPRSLPRSHPPFASHRPSPSALPPLASYRYRSGI